MKLKQRLKTCLALLTLISVAVAPLVSLANPVNPQMRGVFSKLKIGEPVPFDAWCFNEAAVARMVGALEYAKKNCSAQIEIELEKQAAHNKLLVGNLNLRIKTIEEQHFKVLGVKNAEIDRLTAAAMKRPNKYSHWWAIGGFILGAGTAAVIFTMVE